MIQIKRETGTLLYTVIPRDVSNRIVLHCIKFHFGTKTLKRNSILIFKKLILLKYVRMKKYFEYNL